MPELKKILVATALDADHDPSVGTAVLLAGAFNASMTLVHVMPEIQSERWADDVSPELVAGLLDDIRRSVESQGAKVDDTMVLSGRPSYRICQYADQHRADMIVVGASRRKRRDVGLGLTAFHVLRNAVRPVWLSAQLETSVPPSSIVCPMDGSPASRRAYENALMLASQFRAKLTLLRVSETMPDEYARLLHHGDASNSNELKGLRSYLDGIVQDSYVADVELNLQVREGIPHAEILSAVAEYECDLLVMGTEGMSNYPRALVGSVTQKVTRTMPCSICTVCDDDILTARLSATLDRVSAHMSEGRSLLKGRRWLDALVEYEQCLLDEPTYAPAWEGMAEAYESLGDLNKADRCREAASRIRQMGG